MHTSENLIKTEKPFTSIEVFAGGGGLSIGLEQAGFKCLMLNEIDKNACKTLRENRPDWNVVEGDISAIDFTPFEHKIDLLTGGFPCQSFSYAGKRLGLEDTRGTLFYEFARAVSEVKPLIAIGENVKGLLTHDNGKTIEGMMEILEDLGYRVLKPKVLKALHHRVPQTRERLFLVAIRADQDIEFQYPEEDNRIYTLKDALMAGSLYLDNVPESPGQRYNKDKFEVLSRVPAGGNWRDLPVEIQKNYMKKSFYLSGGKTGIARRLSWDKPSLTLTCSPTQNRTERCHPDAIRPLTIREYARIQTFPDSWSFCGNISSQYKQIGNAVPVNLAYAIGQEAMRALRESIGRH
jgi:DNA (cytosine-5)-methyltransferase 1